MAKATTWVAVVMLACMAAVADAQTPAPAYTSVTLTELHCMGCARKISKRVTAVPGVAEVRVDLKAATIWAVHKPGMTPSARAIWEAVEAADHTPTRMDTPAGSLTSKPAS